MVAGQKMQSAPCSALSPFNVIRSGSPGPKDTKRMGCVVIICYRFIILMFCKSEENIPMKQELLSIFDRCNLN
ncbi:hypothetical protein JCM11017A_08430 [Bacteroides fragilis]